jgi:hypothetical protein
VKVTSEQFLRKTGLVRVTVPVDVIVWPFVIGPMGEEPQAAGSEVELLPEDPTPALAAAPTPVGAAFGGTVVVGVAAMSAGAGLLVGLVVVVVGFGTVVVVVVAPFTTVVFVVPVVTVACVVPVVTVACVVLVVLGPVDPFFLAGGSFTGATVVVVEAGTGTVVRVVDLVADWVPFGAAVAVVTPMTVPTPITKTQAARAALSLKARLDHTVVVVEAGTGTVVTVVDLVADRVRFGAAVNPMAAPTPIAKRQAARTALSRKVRLDRGSSLIVCISTQCVVICSIWQP